MDWRINCRLDSSADSISGQVPVPELLFSMQQPATQGVSSSSFGSPRLSSSPQAAIHSTPNEQLAATSTATATWTETAIPDLAPRRHDATRLRRRPGQPGTRPRLVAHRQDTSTTSPPPPHSDSDESFTMASQASRSEADAGGPYGAAVPETAEPTPTTNSGASRRPKREPTTTTTTTPPSNHTQQQHDTHTPQARKSQNRVGKRYRGKLGGEFESLQAALHLEDDDGSRDEDGLSGQEQLEPPAGQQSKARKRRRPVNKTKVMDLARERISLLLQEWEAVEAEAEVLQRQRVAEGW